MKKIPFSKMQGTGNSFLILENLEDASIFKSNKTHLIQKICSTSYGLGVDGVVFLEKSFTADFKMRVYNQDGSLAEMCGNAICCLGKYVFDKKKTIKKKNRFETDSGEKVVEILSYLENQAYVCVDMGVPLFGDENFKGKERSFFEMKGRHYFYVSMGNPHAVCFVDDFSFDYHKEGKNVENYQAFFPNKTNVEYVFYDLKKNALEVRVWERGCGETKSCGTGACAVVVASIFNGKIKENNKKVKLLGGDLEINWQKETKNVLMKGEVTNVAEGFFFVS